MNKSNMMLIFKFSYFIFFDRQTVTRNISKMKEKTIEY